MVEVRLKIVLLLIVFFTGAWGFAGKHVAETSTGVIIASDGKAHYPVIVAAHASPGVRKAAEVLARYLGDMGDCDFELKNGNGKTGISVGTINDFPDMLFKPDFNIIDPGQSQGYEIKSHAKGIYVIGATPAAVIYAVYDLLRRLGYRRYFPMKKWEIVPKKKQLEFGAHIRECPDYYTRRIWPGYGNRPEFREAKTNWDEANGGDGYKLRTGHAYDNIIRKNKEAFAAHPEYYALVDGKRKLSKSCVKFCVANPELRKLVVDYAVKTFQQNPGLESFSMDPSDGGGWCECTECAKIGSPSDRALLLANTVAEAVSKQFKGKRIGMYAYNQHSPPPSMDVHPNVVINVATSFIRGGYSLNDIISGWRKNKATLGIREYYDVYIWSYNAPGRSTGSNLVALKKTIPDFYRDGARYLTAEASDDWGPGGLGYYIAQRILWNIENAKKVENYKKDFLRNCFGPATGTMGKFYELIDGSGTPRLCPDLVGRMYRLLKQARQEAAGKPEILARLDDLVLYTRYCELLMDYLNASTRTRNAALEKMMRFTVRIKQSRMVHSLAVQRRMTRQLSQKVEIDWNRNNPCSPEEIEQFITAGIKDNKLMDFKPVSFSDDLTLVSSFRKQALSGKESSLRRRGTVTYYTWADKEMKPIKLSVTGGLIKHYRDRGNVKINFYKIGGASDDGTRESLVQTNTSVPPDGKTRYVTLQPKQIGLHKIVISDGHDMTRVGWSTGTVMTLKCPLLLSGTFVFYVPKGTKKLGFYCNIRRGYIVAPDGKRYLRSKILWVITRCRFRLVQTEKYGHYRAFQVVSI